MFLGFLEIEQDSEFRLLNHYFTINNMIILLLVFILKDMDDFFGSVWPHLLKQ